MRAYDGQRSDNAPVRRDRVAKRAQLQALKDRLGAMRSHESRTLRLAIESNIKRLEEELARERR
jgi:hypothetical protein